MIAYEFHNFGIISMFSSGSIPLEKDGCSSVDLHVPNNSLVLVFVMVNDVCERVVISLSVWLRSLGSWSDENMIYMHIQVH